MRFVTLLSLLLIRLNLLVEVEVHLDVTGDLHLLGRVAAVLLVLPLVDLHRLDLALDLGFALLVDTSELKKKEEMKIISYLLKEGV